MTWTNMGSGKQALPWVQRDHERSWMQNQKQTMIDEDSCNERHQWRQRPQPHQSNAPSSAGQQTKGGHHKNLRPQQWGPVPDVHQSDWQIPKEVKPRIPVHHGVDWDWQQCNPCQSHEEPHSRGNDPGISGTRRAHLQCMSQSNDAHPWQWVFHRVQGTNQTQQHEVPARAPTQPQATYRRESNSSLQGTHHKYLVWRRQQNIHSTCSGHHVWHHQFQHMHTSGANTITMQTPLHHLDAKLKHTSHQIIGRHEHHTQQAASMLATSGNTTAVTRYISVIPSIQERASQLSLSTIT